MLAVGHGAIGGVDHGDQFVDDDLRERGVAASARGRRGAGFRRDHAVLHDDDHGHGGFGGDQVVHDEADPALLHPTGIVLARPVLKIEDRVALPGRWCRSRAACRPAPAATARWFSRSTSACAPRRAARPWARRNPPCPALRRRWFRCSSRNRSGCRDRWTGNRPRAGSSNGSRDGGRDRDGPDALVVAGHVVRAFAEAVAAGLDLYLLGVGGVDAKGDPQVRMNPGIRGAGDVGAGRLGIVRRLRPGKTGGHEQNRQKLHVCSSRNDQHNSPQVAMSEFARRRERTRPVSRNWRDRIAVNASDAFPLQLLFGGGYIWSSEDARRCQTSADVCDEHKLHWTRRPQSGARHEHAGE